MKHFCEFSSMVCYTCCIIKIHILPVIISGEKNTHNRYVLYSTAEEQGVLVLWCTRFFSLDPKDVH